MSKRPALVLVPGSLCDGALFAEIYKPLSYVADLTVANVSRDDSVTAMADRILAHAPARFSVAGLSMGGYVAMELWRRAPDRVARLGLLNTRAIGEHRIMRRRRGVVAEQVRQKGFAAVLPDLMSGFLSDAHRDRLRDTVTAMALRVGPEAFLRQQTASMNRFDYVELLKSVTVPSLVLCGGEDKLTPPREMQEMAELLPESHYVELSGIGHLSPLEAPHLVTAELSAWLRR